MCHRGTRRCNDSAARDLYRVEESQGSRQSDSELAHRIRRLNRQRVDDEEATMDDETVCRRPSLPYQSNRVDAKIQIDNGCLSKRLVHDHLSRSLIWETNNE